MQAGLFTKRVKKVVFLSGHREKRRNKQNRPTTFMWKKIKPTLTQINFIDWTIVSGTKSWSKKTNSEKIALKNINILWIHQIQTICTSIAN